MRTGMLRSGVVLALLAISVVACNQSIEAPYDLVISECPFSEGKSKDFVSSGFPGYHGGDNYQRNCNYYDGRFLQAVTVFETASQASVYFRQDHIFAIENSSIEFDSNDWIGRGSLPAYPLSEISPPRTDESYTSFSTPDELEYLEEYGPPSLTESVVFRIGRYVGQVEISQPPEHLYHIGREVHLQKVYVEAQWQAAHDMVRQLRKLGDM